MSVAADDTQELGKLIHGVQIPPQPEILVEIDKELQQADPGVPRVACLIRSDVSLSAGVLKVVNSARFGLRTRVESVHQAVTLLGLVQLQGLGYRFFSEGDTEVILKAYAAWGIECVDRFHGMFAFAIWERDSGRLVLARDRLER